MPRDVSWWHSGMPGAPAANYYGVAGGLISVLDACLVNGFNSKTVTSITQSGGVATITTSTAHGWLVNEVIGVAGANEANYNGMQRLLSVPSATTATFAVPGGTASPATGTITANYPSAGWTKDFSGTNTAIYRSKTGKRYYYQIEDNNPYADANVSCRVRLIEGATGFNAGTYVPVAQDRVYKAIANHSTNAVWVVVADGKTCYVLYTSKATVPAGAASSMVAFGEFIPSTVADQYPWFYNKTGNGNLGTYWPFYEEGTFADANSFVRIMRHYSGVGEAGIGGQVIAGLPKLSQIYYQGRDFPSLNDGNVYWSPVLLHDHYDTAQSLTAGYFHFRGRFPGLVIPSGKPLRESYSTVNGTQLVSGVTFMGATRDILLARHGSDISQQVTSAAYGCIGFDLSENWT